MCFVCFLFFYNIFYCIFNSSFRFKFAVILGKRQFPSMECNSKKDGKKEAADLTLRILIAEGQYQLENTVSVSTRYIYCYLS